MPRDPDVPAKRELWVPRQIRSVIAGHVEGAGFPDHVADALIKNYVAGYFITGSMLGNPSGKKPDLERLLGHDEIWVFCFRKPQQQQWRLFGRFLRRNVFVGVRLHHRGELGGKNYNLCAMGALADWNAISGNTEPLKGTELKDYVSEPCRDLYKPIF
jgi:hypothetical protein